MIKKNYNKRISENIGNNHYVRCASVEERYNKDTRFSKNLEKEYLDIKFLVKNSVEKINTLFNNEEFKHKTTSKKMYNNNLNRININRCDLNNESILEEEIKKDSKSNTLKNYINVSLKDKNKNMSKYSVNEEDEYFINNNDFYEELKDLNSNKIKNNAFNNNKKNKQSLKNINDNDSISSSLLNLESNKLYSNKDQNLNLKKINVSENTQKNKKNRNQISYLKTEYQNEINSTRDKKKELLKFVKKGNNNKIKKNKQNNNELKTRNNNKQKVLSEKIVPEESNKFSKTQKLKNINNSLPKEINTIAKNKSNSELLDINININNENNCLNNEYDKKEKKEDNKLLSSIDNNNINKGKKRGASMNIEEGTETSYKKKFFTKKVKKNNVNENNLIIKSESKQIPDKIKIKDYMRMMLMLNQYLINKNFFEDYSNPENKKILENYNLFLANNIVANYELKDKANEEEKSDKKIEACIKIQRKWRKSKIEKYLINNFIEEEDELKKMMLNNMIQKPKCKNIKIIDIFNNVISDCNLAYNNIEEIDKVFYFIQKIIQRKLTIIEKNILYKEYINKVIINK